MSEEEKKAIEELDKFIEDDEIQNISVFTAKKIKNIIDKQQKEIEKLKSKKDNIQVVYGGRRFGTEGMVVKDYISKDEIREKMKHYQELYKEDNSPNDFLIGQNLLSKLSALQELLGE